MSRLADRNTTAEENARRNMDIIGDYAIVFDYRRGVDNAICPNARARIDNGTRHYDRTSRNRGIGRDRGRRMDDARRCKRMLERQPEAMRSNCIVANRNNKAIKSFQSSNRQRRPGTQDWITTHHTLTVIVDEGDLYQGLRRNCRVHYDPGMAARPPYEQFHLDWLLTMAEPLNSLMET